MRGVSCIVPAYNEAPRIAAVLAILAAHPLLDEVIVVDDGSADDTARIAAAVPGVTLLALAQNGGKTRAVAAGIAMARHDHLLLIDADLSGLSADDLTRLIIPVLLGRAEVAISLRQNAPWLWHMMGIDYISGERMLRRDLIMAELGDLTRLPRFGLEVWMNRLILRKGARIAVVAWPAVQSPLKSGKRGLLAGAAADLRMLSDLMQTIPPLGLLQQISTMARRRRLQ